MARVVGVDIPDDKKIKYALTYIHGVGESRAQWLLDETEIDSSQRVSDLDERDLSKLSKLIESNFKVEGELRMVVRDNIRRLKMTGTYRGKRHKRGLPVRGQRTQCNARTRKGHKKKTVGGLSSKKKAARAKT